MHQQTKQAQKHKAQAAQTAVKVAAAIIALVTAIALAPDATAILTIQSLQQKNPVEAGQSQEITAAFTTNATIINALIEISAINYTLQQANSTSFTYNWQPTQLGTNTYKLHLTNAEGEKINYASQYTVRDTAPPIIINHSPQTRINQNPVEIRAWTNENATCKYDTADNSYDSMRYLLSGNQLDHKETKTLPDALYNYYVKCRDESQNTGTTKIISFILDTQPPAINSITPTGTQTSRPHTLRITTNELAMCKWGHTPNEYDELINTFHVTGSTIHLQDITLQEGMNQYFIACADYNYNKNSKTPVSIELNTPPTAKININKEDKYTQLSAKTYQVKLTTSEAVAPTPILTLSCQGHIINVPLEGSNAEWSGFLKIPDSGLECIAEFTYSAIDLKGARGTEITDGKITIISTTKPKAPHSLKAENQERKIIVSWSQPQETSSAVDHYRIYRSTTGNTGQNDLAYTAQLTTHHDNEVQNKIGYFYKVSAVSKSGVESDLSNEAFVKTDFAEDTGALLDSKAYQLIDDKIKELESIIKLAEQKTFTYSSEAGKAKDAIEITGALARMQLATENIKLNIGELKAYKALQAQLPDIEQRISAISQKTEFDKKSIVTEIKTQLIESNEQAITDKMLLESVNEYLRPAKLTEAQKQAYLAEARLLQEKARITKEIWAYELKYLDNASNSGLIVAEDLSITPTGTSEITVLEWLPRDTTKLSELTFQVQPTDVSAAGPYWKMNSLSTRKILYIAQTHEYSTTLGVDNERLLNAATILLPKIEEVLLKEAGSYNAFEPTGKVVASELGKPDDNNNSWWVVYSTIALGALTILLLVYYLRPDSGQKPGSQDSLHSTQPSLDFQVSVAQGSDLISSSVGALIQQSRLELSKGNVHSAIAYYNMAKESHRTANMGLIAGLKSNFELNSLYDEILSRML